LGITPEDGQTRPPEALRGRVRIAASVQGGVRDHGRRGCTHPSRRVPVFFLVILFSGLLPLMAKKGSGQKADDAEDFDPALERFIQSMDFATVSGSNEGWFALFADILTYALFRVFRFAPFVRRLIQVFVLQGPEDLYRQ
jgi:hypothetical protein